MDQLHVASDCHSKLPASRKAAAFLLATPRLQTALAAADLLDVHTALGVWRGHLAQLRRLQQLGGSSGRPLLICLRLVNTPPHEHTRWPEPWPLTPRLTPHTHEAKPCTNVAT